MMSKTSLDNKECNKATIFIPKDLPTNKDVNGISRTVYTHISNLHGLLTNWSKTIDKGTRLCRAISALKLHEFADDYYPQALKPLTESLVDALDSLRHIVEGVETICKKLQALAKLQASDDPVIVTWSAAWISETVENIYSVLQKEYRLKEVVTENIAHCRDENLIEVYVSSWELDPYLNLQVSGVPENVPQARRVGTRRGRLSNGGELAPSPQYHVSQMGMSLDEGRQSQRPYRYGMVLLCAGALINWLGLAEDYAEPVRYVGVACIVAGALLICAAMCCWLQSPARQPHNDRASPDTHQIDDPIHVISMPDEETMQQKPPDYDSVAGAPPTYDDAIKLNPARLLPATSSTLDPTIIPGQPDEPRPALAPVHRAQIQAHTQIPKTPPPPYRPPHAIR